VQLTSEITAFFTPQESATFGFYVVFLVKHIFYQTVDVSE